jgi:hypothetical protein
MLTILNYSVVQTIFWDIKCYSVCSSGRLIVELQKQHSSSELKVRCQTLQADHIGYISVQASGSYSCWQNTSNQFKYLVAGIDTYIGNDFFTFLLVKGSILLTGHMCSILPP